MDIRYKLAGNARPQVMLLLVASLISVALWLTSWFFPIAVYLVYPLQLFATFIHEGSHALAALISGNSVRSLTVSPDGSGVVWSEASGLSALLISSAGYLGTTAYGTLLLVWMRFGLSSRLALYISGTFVGLMTLVFGLFAPFWNLLANVTLGSVIFTVLSGIVLTAGILGVGRFASAKWVNFSLAFLAVQCLLNAFFSLKALFVIAATTDEASDAANMAAATHIPATLWVFLWIAISTIMIAIGVRLYATSKNRSRTDSVFED